MSKEADMLAATEYAKTVEDVSLDSFASCYLAGLKAAREECATMCEDKAEECREHPATPFSHCADARLDEVAKQIREGK